MYFLENIKMEEKQLLELNKYISKDILLTKENVLELINNKSSSLKEIGRIDLTNSILENIILTFTDSSFIDKNNYMDNFLSLTKIFLYYEKTFSKKLSSEEILKYLKDEFEKNEGSIELISTISLERLQDKLCKYYKK